MPPAHAGWSTPHSGAPCGADRKNAKKKAGRRRNGGPKGVLWETVYTTSLPSRTRIGVWMPVVP